jgi:PAS domain S-box-containing protein
VPSPRRALIRQFLPRFALLGSGMALSFAAWMLVAQAEQRTTAREEEQHFGQLSYEVESRMRQVVHVVRGLQGLFDASDVVDRSEFHRYAMALEIPAGTLGLQAVQFARWLPQADKVVYEAAVRADTSLVQQGYPQFRIAPPGDRNFYVPTEFNEPMVGNENAFGLDTAFRPDLAVVFEAARDGGQPVASAPLRLVQSGQLGVVIRAPVYRLGRSPATVQERRDNYVGQVSAVFVVDTLLGTALGNHLGAATGLTLVDLGLTSLPQGPLTPDSLLGHYGQPDPPSIWRLEHRLEQNLQVAGRFWQISMVTCPLNPWLQPNALLAGGLMLALTLLALATMSRTVNQRDRARSLAVGLRDHLQQAEARSAAVLAATLTGIVTVDAFGLVRSANPAACALFGRGEPEMLGQPLALLAPEAAAVLNAGNRHDGTKDGALVGSTCNIIARGRDGSELPLEMSVSELGHGADRQLLATFHDMSAQRRIYEQQRRFAALLEATVQERTAELTRVNQELETFASSVAHDLRAPVRHVHGFARMLELRHGARLDPDGGTLVRRIALAADDMGRLIDELLAFSRLGHGELALQPVELNAVVERAIAAVAPQAAGRVIEWRIGALPVVQADETLLVRAVTNLVSNAIKYSARQPRALIEIFAGAAPAGEVHVCVKDNGVGLDMQFASKLFQVFSRLHHADEFEGTGIGLANVRRIIERCGGRVWVQSEPGRGAQFWFSLPAAAAKLAGPTP